MAGPRYYLSQFVTFLFSAQSIRLQINWVREHKKGANFGSGRVGFAALGTHCTTGDWYLPKHQVTQNNKLYPNNNNPCTNNLDTFWEPLKNLWVSYNRSNHVENMRISGESWCRSTSSLMKMCWFVQKVSAKGDSDPAVTQPWDECHSSSAADIKRIQSFFCQFL